MLRSVYGCIIQIIRSLWLFDEKLLMESMQLYARVRTGPDAALMQTAVCIHPSVRVRTESEFVNVLVCG